MAGNMWYLFDIVSNEQAGIRPKILNRQCLETISSAISDEHN